MCIVSIWVFFTDRNFNAEYFTRLILYQRLNNNPFGYVNYNDIATPDDLYQYMTTTFALQVFYSERQDYGYIFQEGLIPLGKLRMRQ